MVNTKEKAAVSMPDWSAISQNLKGFKAGVLVHLDLEDEEFYPVLLKKLEERGIDTVKTKEFILAIFYHGG